MNRSWDAVVVGSGPNGLTAAIELERRGYSVCVVEASSRAGGATATDELTLPGFRHDHCSAIHPLGLLSPAWRDLRLEDTGLEWVRFPVSIGHPFDDGPAAILSRDELSVRERLGPDGAAWSDLFAPWEKRAHELISDLLGPLGRWPRSPRGTARFGRLGLRSAESLVRRFRGEAARALFGGCAAHSVLPLHKAATAAVGLLFALTARIDDWPCARGGSDGIARALVRRFESSGGTLLLEHPVTSMADLPPSRVVLFDLSPRPFLSIAGEDLPASYTRRLRSFRYGPATFKVDWALDGPIPWRDASLARASTVHVGGSFEEIARAEHAAWEGRPCERPFLILCQQSAVDDSRAPVGKHTGYAYCHVPTGSNRDHTEEIEAQIERFAPGFRELVLARRSTTPRDFERNNPNFVGGAVTGGAADLGQLFTRPVARLDPYSTPNPRLFLCSASTPPGGGVHGMCGYHAAASAARRLRSGKAALARIRPDASLL